MPQEERNLRLLRWMGFTVIGGKEFWWLIPPIPFKYDSPPFPECKTEAECWNHAPDLTRDTPDGAFWREKLREEINRHGFDVRFESLELEVSFFDTRYPDRQLEGNEFGFFSTSTGGNWRERFLRVADEVIGTLQKR